MKFMLAALLLNLPIAQMWHWFVHHIVPDVCLIATMWNSIFYVSNSLLSSIVLKPSAAQTRQKVNYIRGGKWSLFFFSWQWQNAQLRQANHKLLVCWRKKWKNLPKIHHITAFNTSFRQKKIIVQQKIKRKSVKLGKKSRSAQLSICITKIWCASRFLVRTPFLHWCIRVWCMRF